MVQKKVSQNPSDSFICMESMTGNIIDGTIKSTLRISNNLHLDPFHSHKLSYSKQKYSLALQLIEILFQYE